MYAVIYNDTGNPQRAGYEAWGTIISKHRTLGKAYEAFRKRNRHIFDRSYAEQMGMLNAGTFDEIVKINSKNIVMEK